MNKKLVQIVLFPYLDIKLISMKLFALEIIESVKFVMSLWINQNLKNIKKYVNLKIWKANNNLRYNLIKFNILKKKNII